MCETHSFAFSTVNQDDDEDCAITTSIAQELIRAQYSKSGTWKQTVGTISTSNLFKQISNGFWQKHYKNCILTRPVCKMKENSQKTGRLPPISAWRHGVYTVAVSPPIPRRMEADQNRQLAWSDLNGRKRDRRLKLEWTVKHCTSSLSAAFRKHFKASSPKCTPAARSSPTHLLCSNL